MWSQSEICFTIHKEGYKDIHCFGSLARAFLNMVSSDENLVLASFRQYQTCQNNEKISTNIFKPMAFTSHTYHKYNSLTTRVFRNAKVYYEHSVADITCRNHDRGNESSGERWAFLTRRPLTVSGMAPSNDHTPRKDLSPVSGRLSISGRP